MERARDPAATCALRLTIENDADYWGHGARRRLVIADCRSRDSALQGAPRDLVNQKRRQRTSRHSGLSPGGSPDVSATRIPDGGDFK